MIRPKARSLRVHGRDERSTMGATSPACDPQPDSGRYLVVSKCEGLGLLVLALMAIIFLALSWRKWPDPLIDGHQWYTAWRLSHGALLYHDIEWYYGPFSAYFNAGLFGLFGPGIMVLVCANLVVHASILILAYLTFRQAWGALGAFTASAMFICVFSFSQLHPIGNFNFLAPYAHESTHGMLLILAATLVAVRWSQAASGKLALLLGFCGGLSAVIKPEFMLAGGFLGATALLLRWLQRKGITFAEWALLLLGLITPTLLFTVWFARVEPWKTAFIDASQAWWLVLVDRIQDGATLLQTCAGLDEPLRNTLLQLDAAILAGAAVAACWAIGWFSNRSWTTPKKTAALLASAILAIALPFAYSSVFDQGWMDVGRCFPGLLAVLFVSLCFRLVSELRNKGHAHLETVTALFLTIVALAMLARMPLKARITDFGFYQAALAGMVLSAVITTQIPTWTGAQPWGHRITLFACALLLGSGWLAIAAKSQTYRADQTDPVGSGRDRFYAAPPKPDPTGFLVNSVVTKLQSTPPNSTVLVLPEGALINYLSRRPSPVPTWMFITSTLQGGRETRLLDKLRQTPPDYVVLISRPLHEYGMAQFGAPGTPGHALLNWVDDNYALEASFGGDPRSTNGPKGAMVLRRNSRLVSAQPAPPINPPNSSP